MTDLKIERDIKKERRHAVRHQCRVLIETVFRFSEGFSNHWTEDIAEVRGMLVDLDLDGVKLFTKRQLTDGQELRLTLALPSEPNFVARANVSSSRLIEDKGGYVAKAKFIDLPPIDRMRIDRFLRSVAD